MSDLSPGRILILVMIALFVLGPERLPEAAAWLGRTIRHAKTFATAANDQLRRELGPDLDHIRQPLAELRAPLQELRGLRSPSTLIRDHLFGDTPPPPTPDSDPPVSRPHTYRPAPDGPPPTDLEAT